MHDAHVHEMQVQMWKPNTWGVTPPLFLCANQCQKAPFDKLFHVFCVCDLQNNVLQIHVELG